MPVMRVSALVGVFTLCTIALVELGLLHLLKATKVSLNVYLEFRAVTSVSILYTACSSMYDVYVAIRRDLA